VARVVLLLIVAETTQQALVGEDASVTSVFLLSVVLVGTDILLSLVKRWSPRLDRLIERQPLVILRNGSPLPAHYSRNRTTAQFRSCRSAAASRSRAV
jgi:uncharacterized membrane protein YcaP (DUF421 family)